MLDIVENQASLHRYLPIYHLGESFVEVLRFCGSKTLETYQNGGHHARAKSKQNGTRDQKRLSTSLIM